MKVENSNSSKEKQKIAILLVITACIKHLLVFTVKVS